MGKVKGNIQCSDRLDIRSEGSLTGDVITQRISVEDGAILKGSVQVRAAESEAQLAEPSQHQLRQPKPRRAAKAAAAAAGA